MHDSRAQQEMQEIRDLIAFYDARGADWRNAAEFTLGLRSGADGILGTRYHWMRDYIMIPKRRPGPAGKRRIVTVEDMPPSREKT